MPVRRSNPKTIAPPPGYTSVVEAIGPGRTIYVAGQLGMDLNNKLVGAPGDFAAQCEQAFKNTTLALESVGASWRDVVKMNSFLVDIAANMPFFRDIRGKYIDASVGPPVSTTIGVPMLARPGGLFEVEVIAVVPDK